MLHSGMVLAAPQSGSGKTTITCALLAAMKNRKLAVRAFKSRPDYIDPMFHRQVIGVPSRNLDTFFSGADQIRELYGYDRESFSYSVIEGAMGLYDYLGGTQKRGLRLSSGTDPGSAGCACAGCPWDGAHDGGTSGRDITV